MRATQIQEADRKVLALLPKASIQDLEDLILHHNEAYFVHDAPEISDEVFDRIVEALRAVAPDSPILSKVGAKSPSVQKRVVHQRPMLSLDKCYDDATFDKWFEKIRGPVVIMPKIDGVACSLHYDANGNLQLAATRGDGKEGEDITENVKRIKDIPNHINSHQHPLEIRGEVHMKLSRFHKHYADTFANPRNLAAGALKQKDPQKSADYGLSFFPYDVRGASLETEESKFALLKELSFIVPPLAYADSSEEVAQAYKDFAHKRERLDYEIDGIVVRANHISEQERLGETAHHPRYAIAYKFQGDNAQTHMRAVEWSVGRTGVITPVAIVDPVFVSGATVTRASLHNWGMLQKLALREHSLVEIVRRGGVIPHVERVIRAEGALIPVPSHCPSCGSDIVIDGDFVHCSKSNTCLVVRMERLKHFCSVIDLQGFGEKLLTTLVGTGLVTRAADLYLLRVEDLLTLDRMGDVLAQKLIKHIEEKRHLTLPLFLTALGIDEIGPTVAELIADRFKSLDAMQQASVEDFSALHGVGPSIAGSLHNGLREHDEDIKALLKEIQILQAEKVHADKTHPLFGKGVVFTGKMAHLDRKHAQGKVKALGGHCPSSVTREVDFLVVGDEGSPLLGEGQKSSKQKDAEKLIASGHPLHIISESNFLKML